MLQSLLGRAGWVGLVGWAGWGGWGGWGGWSWCEKEFSNARCRVVCGTQNSSIVIRLTKFAFFFCKPPKPP